MYSIKTIFRKKLKLRGQGPQKSEILKNFFFLKTLFHWSDIVSKHFSDKKLKLRGQGPQKMNLGKYRFFPIFFHSSEIIFKMFCRDEVYGESLYRASGLGKGCREVSWHVLDFIGRQSSRH